MNQIFVKTPAGETVATNVNTDESIAMLKQRLALEGVRLICSGLVLNEALTFAQNKLSAGCLIEAVAPLVGGRIENPNLLALAQKYNCEMMICRNCYARNPLGAHNCRRCRCTDLRKKKMGKS